jgi:hypothetical protein
MTHVCINIEIIQLANSGYYLKLGYDHFLPHPVDYSLLPYHLLLSSLRPSSVIKQATVNKIHQLHSKTTEGVHICPIFKPTFLKNSVVFSPLANYTD